MKRQKDDGLEAFFAQKRPIEEVQNGIMLVCGLTSTTVDGFNKYINLAEQYAAKGWCLNIVDAKRKYKDEEINSLLKGATCVLMVNAWENYESALYVKTCAENLGVPVKEEGLSKGDIMQIVTMKAAVSMEDICCKSRKRKIVLARMAYCAIRYKQGLFERVIAKEINRDHSTVNFFHKKHEGEYQFNAFYRAMFNSIIKMMEVRYGH